MDLNLIRIAWTVVSFLVFLAIVAWAYSRGPKRGFDEAALIPFRDDLAPAPSFSNNQRQAVGARDE